MKLRMDGGWGVGCGCVHTYYVFISTSTLHQCWIHCQIQ